MTNEVINDMCSRIEHETTTPMKLVRGILNACESFKVKSKTMLNQYCPWYDKKCKDMKEEKNRRLRRYRRSNRP